MSVQPYMLFNLNGDSGMNRISFKVLATVGAFALAGIVAQPLAAQ